ncbi:MAG: elongation factor G [Armatimonadetes bacterium]|nr:MAG: elongation factor G [Armatimonadota bacterium]
MKVFPPERIRNVALVGHNGSGKTTLAEALLYRAGRINRLGTVEAGNTVTDYDPEEHDRGMSLSLALAPFVWRDHKINLIDTPGYADFAGDVHAALRVTDLAVFVVSAVDGIEVQTAYAWKVAEKLKTPRMIFINKLDKERASFDRTLAELRDRFGAGIAPIELPIGKEEAFHGVADLFRSKAYIYDSGKAEAVDMPEELAEREREVHDNLVEGIVVADDDMLEQYLEGTVPSVTELERTMAAGVAAAKVFPVVCGSATGPIAVDRLADFIVELGPSPLDRPPAKVIAGGQEVEVPKDPDGDPLAFVFKTFADPYVGQVSVFKVLSGTLKPETHLTNGRSGQDERLAKIATMFGKETELVASAPAGDIVAAAKLQDTQTGDTLAPKHKPVKVPPVDRPAPVIATALVPRTQSDDDKLASALHRILEEDSSLKLERNDETRQTLLYGMGETHLNIALEKLERKFGVQVDQEPVRVPFRETITRQADAEGKHKKQSGGHGQYGVCHLILRPLARGEGFMFVDAVKGGSIPRQYIPAVEKGVVETMQSGGRHGYPVVDVEVTVDDGKAHSVDSNEMSFKLAARAGFREAFEAGSPVLLEPISIVSISVPMQYQGDVMGDIAARRGSVQGSEASSDGFQIIKAMIPTSEIVRYAIDLRSLTHGWGTFSAEHDHYQEMPSHLVDKAVADAQ